MQAELPLLVEVFDVSNCQHTLLNALISNLSSIPEDEKRRYYEITCSGKFYEDISAYFSCLHDRSKGFYDRQFIKEAVNKYYNVTNRVIQNAHSHISNQNIATIDDYFKDNFPHIRKYILRNREKAFPDDKEKKLNKLHLKLNEVETNIITREICINELLNKYHIKAISLHDGIYMKQSDYQSLKENNISLEKMFFDKLFLYSFI